MTLVYLEGIDFFYSAGIVMLSMAWDYTKTEYEKQASHDEKWHLERIINYGNGKEKLSKNALEKYLKELRIPDDSRAFLELILWNKKF